MYLSLSKDKLMNVILREFEIRFKGIVIPEMEIIFEPDENKLSIFSCRDESTDDFIEILRKHKLLLRADQFFIFINTELLMKLFFCEYRISNNGIEFFNANEFGITDFVFPVLLNGIEKKFTISAGNLLHAYIKAIAEPNWGHFAANMDLRSIVVVH